MLFFISICIPGYLKLQCLLFILNLLQNNLLIKEIQKNNVTLYFAFHHRQLECKAKIMDNKYIKFIFSFV